MEGKRVTVADAESPLNLFSDELNSILSCETPLTAILAVRLEEIGWGNAEGWVGTQAIWDIAQARQQISRSAKVTDSCPSRRSTDFGFDIHLDVPHRPRPIYRPRCANIVIASSGHSKSTLYTTRFGQIRSRNGASLEYTTHDAGSVYALWTKDQSDSIDELDLLLIDPSIKEVEGVLTNTSARLREAAPVDVGLDIFFAGHGEEGTGNLVLKDGSLSPTRLLELQADDVNPKLGGLRTMGICLDSCYSGAFLLKLAIEAFDDFEGFRLDNGLASCLPDEECFEMEGLKHGAFTYTYLHKGNAHIDQTCFNRAVLENDEEELQKGLQGLVGMMSNPSAFLTEGKQFSMSLMKNVITVDGGFATVELGERSDFEEIKGQLVNFKRAGV